MTVSSDEIMAYEPATATSRRTRIDGAHAAERESSPAEREANASSEELLEVAEEPTPELLAAVAGQTLEARREQLQLQVSQLAGHLRDRLREVDRREAAVNARASQLEADLRASRLWLRERENAFQERESELQRQIEVLQDQATPRAGDAGDKVDRHLAEFRQQELVERERQTQLRENELRDRRFEIEREAAALRHAQQLWEQERSREERGLAQQREMLEAEFRERSAARERELQAAEALLSEHSVQIDNERAVLAAERQAWHEQKTRQQQALEERRAGMEAELHDRSQQLEARQDWIERQKAGLEQVRSEILGLHRQSLEMRLIAEQLWSQITGRMAPADVTHAVAQLRLKLAEQYRLEEQNLEARREELVALGERITAQHGELKQLQGGLREWAATRQTEIEEQAAALVQRELALDEQQEELRSAQHQWQADRRALEQQIRDLHSKLRAMAVT